MACVIGVLAIQGAFLEHIDRFNSLNDESIVAKKIRCAQDLQGCHGLVLPGGESTTMALVAKQSDLWAALQDWVKLERPTWGTCAGLILLASSVSNAKTGQEFLGGLDIHVARNAFGAQLASFEGRLSIHEDHLPAWKSAQRSPSSTSHPAKPLTGHPLGARRTVTSSFEAAIAGKAIPTTHTGMGGENAMQAEDAGIFIRAPAILRVGDNASVLATVSPPPLSASAPIKQLPQHSDHDKSSSQKRVIVAAASFKQAHALPTFLGTAFHPELTSSQAWHRYFVAMVREHMHVESAQAQETHEHAQAAAAQTG